MLSQGYSVSGVAAKVDAYIKGKSVIGIDTLGGLKSAYVMGKREADPDPELDFSALDLQKLFIELTNS